MEARGAEVESTPVRIVGRVRGAAESATGQTLTVEEVRKLEPGAFTRHDGGVLNFGYTESAYWVRLDLRPGKNPDQTDWILELALPLVDEVALFMVRHGTLVDRRRACYADHWPAHDLLVA